VVAFFKEAELKELELLRRVRKKNDAKTTNRKSANDKTPPSQTNSDEVSRLIVCLFCKDAYYLQLIFWYG